ncbi:hypothetical protein D3C72_1875730 [compost metagenome]
MERQAVIELALHELLEVRNRLGRFLGEEHDAELALRGGEGHRGARHDLLAGRFFDLLEDRGLVGHRRGRHGEGRERERGERQQEGHCLHAGILL